VRKPHEPVMLTEVLAVLDPRPGGLYVDGTLGAGGHAAAVLAAAAPGGRLLGLDRDPQALRLAEANLREFGDRVVVKRASFDQMGEVMRDMGWDAADGILLDLGVSSMQLDQAGRGFSFRQDAPLDMRMGPEGQSAAELLAEADERELARVLKQYGEEPFARRIAQVLVRARAAAPIATTGRLAELVEAALPAAERRKRKLHPATQVFQGLRIAVNDEIGRLERFLDALPGLLRPGGRVAVISYHSLEDRPVKRALAALARPCHCPPRLAVCVCGKKPLVGLLTPKALRPGADEVAANPRARSARLRAAVRTEAAA
jgi:16S rRNA (cytosine1402-N4)-methyltransferase